MEEWKEYKLKEICLRITDGSHSSPKSIALGYPMFSVKDMLENRFDYTRCKYISKDDFLKLKKGDCVPQEGDVLVAKDGSFLKQIFVCKETKEECILSSIAIFRPNKNIIYPEFLSYLFKSPKVYNYIANNCVSGSALPRIILKDFKEINVAIPNLSIQKNVLDILLPLDDKIELNRRINEHLEQQAQALFKSWFVDFEPFKDGKFVDSELGMIPEGWRVGTIGDYCKIRSGFAFKSSWWTERGVKIVKIKNISSSGILNMDDCSYVSKENVSKAKEFSLKSGDILIAMTGATIGKFCLVPAIKEEIYVNQRVGKFFLGENPIMKIPFIHGLLKCENIISQIINKGQGSAQPNISGNDIETIPIIYPPEDIISKYNELVSPYFSMIIENISACDFISQLRDTLLPRLMSGKLEIKDNSYD